MKFYWVKTHPIMKVLFPKFIWDMPSRTSVYLTFDDGPTPEITEWVLSELEKYNAKATFFCIGNNIRQNPELFQNISQSGHAIGNHTYNHVNGWHTLDQPYLENVVECEAEMSKLGKSTNLFRPPYGKLSRIQTRQLLKKGYKIIMWDILSADFDHNITPEKCWDNVYKNIKPGSIIIFHDSIKASKNLKYVLPKTLEYINKKGYDTEILS